MNHGRLVAVAAAAAVFACAHASWAAQAPAQPGTKAVLDVEYVIEGKFSQKRQMDSTDWRVKRSLKVSYEIYATPLAKFGISDPSHTAEVQTDSAALSAQGQAAVANNADLMARMQAAEEACGDDDACMERFAMQMAQQPGSQQQLQKMSKDANAVMGNAQAMNAKSPPRYQQWRGKDNQPVKIGGQASLEETLHQTAYDPICYKTNNICTFDRARKGARAVDASMTELAAASPTIEVDTVKDLVSVVLPVPFMDVTADEKTPEGTKKVAVPFIPGYLEELKDSLKFIGKPLAGAYTSQKGERTIKIARLAQDYDGPVTMTIRWHFHTP